jgi:hypothetical protein
MALRNAIAGTLVLAATLGLVTTPNGVAQAQAVDYGTLVSARTIQESTIARTAVPVVSKATIGQVRVDLSVVDESGGTIGLSTEVVAVSGHADTSQMEAAREAAQEAWSAFEAETPNATPEQRRRAFDAGSDPQDDAFDRIEAVRALAAPDLVITDVQLAYLKMNPPIPIVFYRVENQWIGDAEAFQVSAYLSTDALIDPTDVLVSSATVPGLLAGAAYEEIIPLPTPKGVAQGTYILGAFADPQDEVLEMNGAGTAEENNGWAGDTFTVADEPLDTDLKDAAAAKSGASASDADPVKRLDSPNDLQERVDDANKLEQLAGSNGDLFVREIPGAGSNALGTDGKTLGIGDPFKEKDPSDLSGFGKGALGLPSNPRDAQSQRQSQFDALLGDKAKGAPGADPLGGGLMTGDSGGMDQLGLKRVSPDDLQKSAKASQDGGSAIGAPGGGDSRLMRGGRRDRNLAIIGRDNRCKGGGCKNVSNIRSYEADPGLEPIPTGSGSADPKLEPIPTGNEGKKAAKKGSKAKAKKAEKAEKAKENDDKKMCPDGVMNCGQRSDPKSNAWAEAVKKAGEEAKKDQQSLINPGPDGSGTTSNRTFKRVDSKQVMQESLNPYIIPNENSSSSGAPTMSGTPDLDPANSTLVDPPKDGSGSNRPGGGMPGSPDGGMPGGSIPTP